MKKTSILIGICMILILAASLAAFVAMGGNSRSGPAADITKDEAKQIALQDAKEALEDVTFTRNTLQEEDGRQVYVEDFYRDDISYHYMIDAETGSIYRKDTQTVQRVISKDQGTDIDQKTDTEKTGQTTAESGSGQTEDVLEYIGVEHAKSIALEHAGLTREEVQFDKAKLDHEEGRIVYEIEFKYRGAEYEYKLDARTGSVVEKDVEIDED